MNENLPAINIGNMQTQELATLMRLHRDAIQKDIQAGCPVVHRGSGKGDSTIINIVDWHNWKVDRARKDKRYVSSQSDISMDAKDRMLEATASKREVELAKMRGELFPLADLDMFISDEMVSLRTAILSVEERISELVGLEAARMVQDILINAVNGAVEAMQDLPEDLAGHA